MQKTSIVTLGMQRSSCLDERIWYAHLLNDSGKSLQPPPPEHNLCVGADVSTSFRNPPRVVAGLKEPACANAGFKQHGHQGLTQRCLDPQLAPNTWKQVHRQQPAQYTPLCREAPVPSDLQIVPDSILRQLSAWGHIHGLQGYRLHRGTNIVHRYTHLGSCPSWSSTAKQQPRASAPA